MSPLDQKQALFGRIEQLWLEAAAVENDSPPPPSVSTDPVTPSRYDDPVLTHAGPGQDGAVFERITNLMHEAETVQQAANDSLAADDLSIDDLAQAINPDIGSNDFNAFGMTSADFGAPGPQHSSTVNDGRDDTSFEGIKSKFEAVSQLQPPLSDNRLAENPEYAFGEAFSNLVRSVVRTYIKDEFEETIQHAISDEIKAHFSDEDAEDKSVY